MIKPIFLFAVCIFLTIRVSANDVAVVSVVVPFSAGSAQDAFARLISEPLGRELGSQVVIVNKPGAGGTLGAAYVHNAKPDGKTYLMAGTSLHLAGALYPGLPYHPLESFQGAAFLGNSEFVLITAESMNTPTLASFVARVRADPKTFNYGSAGNGSVTHVGLANFLQHANLQMTHIPLKGTGEVIHEILAGRVQAAMVSSFSIYGHRSDARIKLLAVTGKQRSDYFPNLPTLSELGYTKFSWAAWIGLLAPAHTPTDKINAMNQAVARVLADPVMKSQFYQLGIAPKALPNHEFETVLKNSWVESTALISKIKPSRD
jgi:tripartite-type tricarboxylate transporter receptor subunit TctC